MALEALNVIPDNIEAYNIMPCVLIRQKKYKTFYSIKLNLRLCYFYHSEYLKCLKILQGIRGETQCFAESIEDIVTKIKKIIVL